MVYNNSKSIAECLDSVNSQQYKHIEHIIQDGGSTDGTLDTINAYMSKHRRSLISETDSGIYDALNRAISRTNGDIIGILHSDDIFASNNTINQIATAFKDNKTDAVYGDILLAKQNKLGNRKVIRKWVGNKGNPYLGWMPPHPSFFIRKDTLIKCGLYNTNFKISGDYEAMMRWICIHKINYTYLPETITIMSMGGSSTAGLASEVTKLIEDYKAIKMNRLGGFICLFLKKIRKFKQYSTKSS